MTTKSTPFAERRRFCPAATARSCSELSVIGAPPTYHYHRLRRVVQEKSGTCHTRSRSMPTQHVPDVWSLSDLCTPWCVHVAVTLRVAEHIAGGTSQIA